MGRAARQKSASLYVSTNAINRLRQFTGLPKVHSRYDQTSEEHHRDTGVIMHGIRSSVLLPHELRIFFGAPKPHQISLARRVLGKEASLAPRAWGDCYYDGQYVYVVNANTVVDLFPPDDVVRGKLDDFFNQERPVLAATAPPTVDESGVISRERLGTLMRHRVPANVSLPAPIEILVAAPFGTLGLEPDRAIVAEWVMRSLHLPQSCAVDLWLAHPFKSYLTEFGACTPPTAVCHVLSDPWDRSTGDTPRHAIGEFPMMLQPNTRALVIADRDTAHLLLAHVLGSEVRITHDEQEAVPGRVFAIDPRAHEARRLTSYRLRNP